MSIQSGLNGFHSPASAIIIDPPALIKCNNPESCNGTDSILNLGMFARAKMLRFSYTERLGLHLFANSNSRSIKCIVNMKSRASCYLLYIQQLLLYCSQNGKCLKDQRYLVLI